MAAQQSALRSITRELTLYEIAIMTRAAPARLLGLRDRGHLGVGRRGRHRGVSRRAPTARRCSATPEYVFKDGALVARAGRITAAPVGGMHFVEPEYDAAIEKTLRRHYASGTAQRESDAMRRSAATSCAAAANGGAACFRRAVLSGARHA